MAYSRGLTCAQFLVAQSLQRNDVVAIQLPTRLHDPIAVYQYTYTGGATGHSKGALLTHANVLAVLDMAQAYVNACGVKIAQDEVILTALPLYYIFAFKFLLFFKLCALFLKTMV